MNAPTNTQYRHLTVRKFAGAAGADVTGVDLSQDVSDDVLAEIRAALLDNLVICIRDQHFSPEQQLRLAKRWGEIHLQPFMQGMKDFPEILAIINKPTDKKNARRTSGRA
jgi:taurine dioxygenase